MKARTNIIAHASRAAGNVRASHDRVARQARVFRLHAVCPSVTSVSPHLRGRGGDGLVLFMV